MSHVTVFLVRHGAHDLLGRVLVGRRDGVSLNADGRAQAERAAARLSRERVAAIYSSPLERTRETAAPIADAARLPVEIDEGVVELDYGAWTGVALPDLAADPRWCDWNRHRATSRIPDGETMEEVRRRAAASIERWRRRVPGGAVAAATHGDVIKAVVCGLIGLPFGRVHDFEVDPGSVTTLVAWDGGGKLLTLNEVPA